MHDATLDEHGAVLKYKLHSSLRVQTATEDRLMARQYLDNCPANYESSMDYSAGDFYRIVRANA